MASGTYERDVHWVPVSQRWLTSKGTDAMRPILTRNTAEPSPAPDIASTTLNTDRTGRRLVRFAPEVVRELPDERLVRIDVNGCLAGTVLAVPDAPRELAAGWAFIHGFFDDPCELGRITIDRDRVSLMVESGEDIDRRRLEAVGWAEPGPYSTPESTERESFRIGEVRLADLVDATWNAFRRDGGSDGYLHAGVATCTEIRCIARDRTSDIAAAKVLGWMLLDRTDEAASVLLVRGIVGRQLVEAAARIGIALIVTSAILTAEAFRAATGLSMSVIGMATARSMGLLVDGGHIVEWTPKDETADNLEMGGNAGDS